MNIIQWHLEYIIRYDFKWAPRILVDHSLRALSGLPPILCSYKKYLYFKT